MFQNKIDGFLLFAVHGQDLTDFAHFFASGKPALHRQGSAKKISKFSKRTIEKVKMKIFNFHNHVFFIRKERTSWVPKLNSNQISFSSQ